MSTIDPGVEDALKESANDLDDTNLAHQHSREIEDFRLPSSRWFASTACPLLAGTFGPIANAFSICALVYPWRVHIPPGGSESNATKIVDPSWLDVLNALSLFSALVGNASLLLNMARRLRFSIAQPITITGFLLAGVLLVSDMAILSSSSTYWLTDPSETPAQYHALSPAFYYAIFATVIYFIIGALMCLTVYGANRGYYEKDFSLTSSQRTLMLQTMSFVAYLLLGALVFSKIEGWKYLDAVYWADVTLLTVGLGDFSPQTHTGRSLLFPFAIGGILIIGLVIGSIRSLVLERGEQKMSARIIEKRRSTAVNHVNENKQTIKISYFARADFSTDPEMSAAQRREEEFRIMRKVQAAAERERRWFSLFSSSILALLLWFLGALVFMFTEKSQGWTYFASLDFAYVCLLTIGYGDLTPVSDAGRAFFVMWSLLAVPTLTILISNMGDTVVKVVSDVTVSLGSITVLPSEAGFRESIRTFFQNLTSRTESSFRRFTPTGLLGDIPSRGSQPGSNRDEHHTQLQNRLSEMLLSHFEDEELEQMKLATAENTGLERDIHFYHYVLSRECRQLLLDVFAKPSKEYKWEEWEYYLKLMGTDEEGKQDADDLVPDSMRLNDGLSATIDSVSSGDTVTASRATARNASSKDDTSTKDERKSERARQQHRHIQQMLEHKKPAHPRRSSTLEMEKWSWLSPQSPLMSNRSEAEWLLNRLSVVLEREMNRQRRGIRRQPPIGWSDMKNMLGHEKEQ